MHSSRLLLVVFESRPLPFLGILKRKRRPSPLPPIPFFKFPPRKKSEWRGAARREGGTRGTPRVAGFRVATRSERTMQFQATTHAERAKSVPLEKGSRKGYDYTARQDLADELLKK
ncbi:hypothetical protein A2851_01180 [Candidatus Kaiserbacteria bacterium RIFCSPHIGHO2_01_FULL_53_29]|uniref:Uncharacterized protein n=1 Tax=Candidatus Kaiserbacteria bacterium RIFCSPHIGHO2_01_FULL_53_29 TaxID=1798480 RepID=A0A1F6CYX0_9BACT|nr:MAG: hypothetical protein A2851_01180 [Candidatus Kaiserbacteria bacterium RIFCSPHIGHO2_01_FULL_53_29]